MPKETPASIYCHHFLLITNKVIEIIIIEDSKLQSKPNRDCITCQGQIIISSIKTNPHRTPCIFLIRKKPAKIDVKLKITPGKRIASVFKPNIFTIMAAK